MNSGSAAIINNITKMIVDPIILVMFSLGFLFLAYGAVEFIMALNKGADTKKGVNHMIWGIVGILIMSSVDALLALIDNTFHFGALSGGSSVDTSSVLNAPDFARFR